MLKKYIKNLTNTHWLIALLAVSIIVTMTSLAWIEQSQRTPHDWWVVYFVDPHAENNNFDFVIENYTQQNDFRYEISTTNTTIEENSILIESNNIKKLHFSPTDYQNNVDFTITVTHGGDKRTLERK